MCDLCHGLQSKNGHVAVGIDVNEDAIAQAKEKCPLGEFDVANVTNYFQQKNMKLKPRNRLILHHAIAVVDCGWTKRKKTNVGNSVSCIIIIGSWWDILLSFLFRCQ
jgi:hypothetical protein